MTAAAGLTPMQHRSIAEADGKINVWEGAIRSGKTVGSLLRWLGHIVEMRRRPGEVIVVGATRESIARNVFGPLQSTDLLGRFADEVHYTAGAPTGTVLGIRVHVIGANDAKAEPKLRGVTAKSIYADEITVLPEAFFKQALGRMSVPGAALFGTTNPGPPNHWLRQDFLLRAHEPDLDLRHWHFAFEDNTFLPPDYVAQQKAAHTGLFYRRFILGEWVAAEGAVFDMWDEDRHVVTGPLTGQLEVARLVAAGCDYGTSNPFHAVMLAELADGRLCLTRELRHDPRRALVKLTDVDLSRRMIDWLGADQPPVVAVDPSAASFKEQLRRDRVRGVQDADNTVLDGIRLFASLLGTDDLVVHESCTGLRAEMPGYSWDDDASAKGEDKPLKVDDHGVDGARYALQTSRYRIRSLKRVQAGRAARARVARPAA